MIYDDVENGDEGGNSSLEYGWSSSEFESYEEQSDSECKNGVPRSFLRSNHRQQVCAQPPREAGRLVLAQDGLQMLGPSHSGVLKDVGTEHAERERPWPPRRVPCLTL